MQDQSKTEQKALSIHNTKQSLNLTVLSAAARFRWSLVFELQHAQWKIRRCRAVYGTRLIVRYTLFTVQTRLFMQYC